MLVLDGVLVLAPSTLDSSKTISNSHEVLNFNRFICNSPPILPRHSFRGHPVTCCDLSVFSLIKSMYIL